MLTRRHADRLLFPRSDPGRPAGVPCGGGGRSNRRRAFSLPDLFWILFILALLISILLPSLSRARELAKRAQCAANLRGLGQSCLIYANDNLDWFPHHYYETQVDKTARPPVHGVRWVGSMGSNDFLRITEATSPKRSPMRNHPSRSLFMLVIAGMVTPQTAVCPSSGDPPDPLRNREGEREIAAQPGVNRFDFRGYTTLSYGYQLPYGPNARPRFGRDPRMVAMADKGPYYTAGGEELPGSGTVVDARSDIDPPQATVEEAQAARRVLDRPAAAWRPYNSRNHAGEGQNVLFFDCAVQFEKRPVVGLNYDNIYTLAADFTFSDSVLGMVPGPEQAVGPLTNTDCFIVP